MTNETETKKHKKSTLRDDERRFVEDITSLLTPWGLSPSMGRVYGYLLLRQEPVSLDHIAAELGISKVGAWNAARQLETFGHVQRYGTPGSKRALYAPSDDFAAPLRARASLLGEIGSLLRHCASGVAGNNAAAKLEERAGFYESIRAAMEERIDELNSQRADKQRPAARSFDGRRKNDR